MFSTLGYYICIPFAWILRLFYNLTNSYGLALIFFTLIGTSADDVHSPLFIASVAGQIVLTILSALVYAALRKRDRQNHSNGR